MKSQQQKSRREQENVQKKSQNVEGMIQFKSRKSKHLHFPINKPQQVLKMFISSKV